MKAVRIRAAKTAPAANCIAAARNMPDHHITFRTQFYTEVIRDGSVIALYKQGESGDIEAYGAKRTTAFGLNALLGVDATQSSLKKPTPADPAPRES